jgi:predicted transcriptional regulator
MKRGIDNLASQRSESEAVIIREALSEYLKKSAIGVDGKPVEWAWLGFAQL